MAGSKKTKWSAIRKSKAAPKKTTNVEIRALAKRTAVNTDDFAFPIVGIGTSAGGLDSLERFFKNMPGDSGMAFIVVAHLDPSHATLLPELLQKFTRMRVALVEDEMRVDPNSVYIIPPNKSMTIAQKKLFLFPKAEPYGSRLSIDTFMRSLAEDQGRNAAGIIMSGAGADGTMGIRAIKNEGGLTLAQDLDSAKYDGMPGSAIASGMVDFVLPPEKMSQKLITFAKNNAYIGAERPVGTGREATSLRKIFALLRANTGHDFSLYKQKTIWRRVLRRMTACRINDVAAYANYLDVNRAEVKNLFHELLIGVTNFFRDPDAFESLKQKAIIPMMQEKPENYAFRVWVPGCATGEEVYSLAILFKECLEELGKRFAVQFFGTDIDEAAIETARSGVYPLSIASDAGGERLKSYFARVNSAYRIRKDVREMMVFAIQDIIKDPPFIKMDLVSCRNLLIYMEPELQKRIIPIFHYALNPGGALILGYSESVGSNSEFFEVVDKKWKIFRRIGKMTHPSGLELYPAVGITHENKTVEYQEYEHAERTDIKAIIRRSLLDNFAPPCAVIDQNDNIVYIHGRIGKYLEPAAGAANLNIIEMARPPIRNELVAAIRGVRSRRRETVHNNIKLRMDGETRFLNLRVKPILEADPARGLVLVIFEGVSSEPERADKKGKLPRAASQKIMDLERELKSTKSDLEVTIEELQGSNEELRSANEELQSSNEELQSSNEEMETSKEELQSLNEELVTVNTELQSKMEELARTNDDLKNFIDATSIATIFLDTRLHINRFTPMAMQIVSLIESDIGRPISDLTDSLVDVNLTEDAKKVLETLVFEEKEVRDKNGQYFKLRIVPYRTLSNVIDGVVVSFMNIPELKQMEQEARDAMSLAENIVETVQDPLLVLNSDLKVVTANHAFHDRFGTEGVEIEGQPFYIIGDNAWNNPELRNILDKVIPDKSTLEDYPLKIKVPALGERQMLLNAREIEQGDGKSKKILLAFRNITEKDSDNK
jgi:two-component system CheB/CheR fusion protein